MDTAASSTAAPSCASPPSPAAASLLGAQLRAGRAKRAAPAPRRRASRRTPSSASPPTASSRSSPRTRRSARASRRCCRCSSPRSWTSTGRTSASSRPTSDPGEVRPPVRRRQHRHAAATGTSCAASARPAARCWSGRGRATWGVPAAECHAASGAVHHRASGPHARLRRSWPPRPRRCRRPTSRRVTLKDPKDYKIIGQADPGRRQPDDRHRQAALRHRRHGARDAVRRLREVPGVRRQGGQRQPRRASRRCPGVRHAFVVEGTHGRSTGLLPRRRHRRRHLVGARRRRAQKLQVTWDEGPTATQSSAGFAQRRRPSSRGSRRQAACARTATSTPRSQGAAKIVEAAYSYPFLAHAHPRAAELHGRTSRTASSRSGRRPRTRSPAASSSPRPSASPKPTSPST